MKLPPATRPIRILSCRDDFSSPTGAPAATMITLRLLAIASEAIGDSLAADEARARADRLDDPRDVSARTVVRFLTNLTRPS